MFNKNLFFLTLCVLLSVTLCPGSSFAHKVMIFGWVEGDRVNTISKFNGGKKVKNAPVSVYNSEGTLIIKGTTDTAGEFSFKRPGEKGGLKVVLEASMGHKTSCMIDIAPEEVSSAQSKHLPPQEPALGNKDIERIIETAIDKKLAVILKLVAEKEEKQTLSEIISGIGYILGLIGVALWVRSR